MSRVLILCPTTFGYEKRTRDALERIGFTVTCMDERIGNSPLAKGLVRSGIIRCMPWLLNSHVRRIVTRVRDFRADFLLLLDPENITGKELVKIKSLCPTLNIIIYTWDTFNRKPISPLAFKVSDAVYSFDPVDCDKFPELRHVPLFHNHTSLREIQPKTKKYDFSFVGTARGRRIRVLAQLQKELIKTNRPHYFHIVTQSALHHIVFSLIAKFYGYSGALTRSHVPYNDYLAIIQESRCIVDIEFSDQTGLTMRTFEVVFSGVPLLTTNEIVSSYDFFDASSIFIFNERLPHLPPNSQLIEKINKKFFDKYSIDTWARTIMGCAVDNYMK